MRPVTVSCVIDAARERVFDYLSDLANHVEFSDHYLEDFRLERLDSRGAGAAASFRVALPLGPLWAEAVVTDFEPPHRIVIEGGAGRLLRIGIRWAYTLTLHELDMTRLELAFSSEPATSSDVVRELLGGRLWLTYQSRRAMRRLKHVLERGEPSAHAVQVAAG